MTGKRAVYNIIEELYRNNNVWTFFEYHGVVASRGVNNLLRSKALLQNTEGQFKLSTKAMQEMTDINR